MTPIMTQSTDTMCTHDLNIIRYLLLPYRSYYFTYCHCIMHHIIWFPMASSLES